MNAQLEFLMASAIIQKENKLKEMQAFLRTLEKGGWRDYCMGRYGRYDEATFKAARRSICLAIDDLKIELADLRGEVE